MKTSLRPIDRGHFPGSCLKQGVFSLLLLCSLLFIASSGQAAQGVSIDGKLKYPHDFSHFAYTSAQAKKGGDLILHDIGSFDSMNPYILKANSPAGLEQLVFESLAVSGLDEPFAKYGLIASDILLAADGLSVTFTINPLARFSDDTPITPADVKRSLEIMKSDKSHPRWRSYFQDISGAEVLDEHRVRFLFSQKNRELHLIACELPVFSPKFLAANPFESPGMTPPVGSGPYLVEAVNPGKSITYRRNPHYWAQELNVRKYMFNYDSITYKYYKDPNVALEAFKAGEFNFLSLNIAKQWARDLSGDKFDNGLIVKEVVDHSNNAGMQCFVFNTRKPQFKDRKVRQALGLAFDFAWTNRNLFFDQYIQSRSFFNNSIYAAKGLPQGRELEYLKPFADQLPPEVFTTPLTPASTATAHELRQNMKSAQKLLAEAGWSMSKGGEPRLEDPAGNPLEFEILLTNSSFERVVEPYVNNLKKLGVLASYRTIDPALYLRRLEDFEFDMLVFVFGQSQSPGNEQRDYWHSSSASNKGSLNLAGIKDPVIDNLAERVIYAQTQEELIAACRALDRALWYGYYVVPHWYYNKYRLAYWNLFSRPETMPVYYDPLQALMTWWMK